MEKLTLKDICRPEANFSNVKVADLIPRKTIMETGDNWSSIRSFLVKEAARCCDRYASDIIVSINSVSTTLKDIDFESGRFAFGFRDYGVDHNLFIECKLSNPFLYEKLKDCYKSLYVLDVSIVASGEYNFKLSRVF